jgi:hypothetical protein
MSRYNTDRKFINSEKSPFCLYEEMVADLLYRSQMKTAT